MGISKVVGSMATAFLLASLLMLKSGIKLISTLFFYKTLVAFIVTFASHPAINVPFILGKKPNGRFPIWSKTIFGPFLIFARCYVLFKRIKRRGKEPAFTEIAEGLFVGGWPTEYKHLPPGDPVVIDCTCELPRSNVVVEDDAYLCVPTWDTRAPKPDQIESAVRFASRFRAQKKPVFVHCAFGHGRSVCVMCALLVALGLAEDWKIAEKMVREKRPLIRMNASHRKNLEEWSKRRHLSKSAETGDSK